MAEQGKVLAARYTHFGMAEVAVDREGYAFTLNRIGNVRLEAT